MNLKSRDEVTRATRPSGQATLTVRTGLRAGDVYLHNPRGSNDRLSETQR
jgi:hypothetical protein